MPTPTVCPTCGEPVTESLSAGDALGLALHQPTEHAVLAVSSAVPTWHDEDA